MSPAKRRAISRKGGLNVQAKGTGYRWTPVEARAAAFRRLSNKGRNTAGAKVVPEIAPAWPVDKFLTLLTELEEALKRR